MKTTRAWGLIVGSVVLSIAGACGSSPTSVEERSELRGSGSSIEACCYRAVRPGWPRGHCLAEAAHGHGVCGHLRPHDGGRSDAAPGGSGGVAGVAGAGGEAGGAGTGGEAGGGGAGGAGAGGAAGGAGSSDAGGPLGGAGGSAAVDGGPDGQDGSADAGTPGGCVPPSPADIWERGALPAYPSVLFATRSNDLWMIDRAKTVFRGNGTNWAPVLTAPANEYFYALWGSSPDDVWVGGTRPHHWNGATWSDVTPPELLVDPSREVRTLVGRTPDDVWVVAAPLASGLSGRLFHWDGSSWTERTPPDSLTGGTVLVGDIWVSPSHDAWAAAYWLVNGVGSPGVLRWTGAAWESASADLVSINFWHSIWGSADDDVWVAGPTGMAHFDGVSWRQDPTVTGSRNTAPALWGSCARDIWALGTFEQVWHFDGVRWSRVVLELSSRVALRTVTGTGPDDVWFGGSDVVTEGAFTSWHHYPGDLSPVCGNVRIDPGEDCDPPDGRTCDGTCHSACVAAGATCAPAGFVCCDGLGCIGGRCQCLPTGSFCTDTDTCCADGCTNGHCGGCAPFGSQCDAAMPCCSGLVCSNGLCLNPPPACMPDGALCSTTPCCSGAACVNGLCGGACVLFGAACDGSHPCCTPNAVCTNGVCGGITCRPEGSSCGSGLECCFPLCSHGTCGPPACGHIGESCGLFPRGCCAGYTCVGGTCQTVLGCYPTGQDCDISARCCSGLCALTGERGRCL